MTCACDSRETTRAYEGWPLHWYGYGIAWRLRVHHGACPLHDEVLSVQTYRIAAPPVGARIIG